MHRVVLPETGSFAAWRDAARPLAAHGVPAGAVEWVVGEAAAPTSSPPSRCPRARAGR